MCPGPKAVLTRDVPVSSITNANQQLIGIPDKDADFIEQLQEIFFCGSGPVVKNLWEIGLRNWVS